jgi:F-type H+-transporting ATPase subunit delta
MSLAVANRYARAFTDLVLAPNSGIGAGAAIEQIRSFEELVESSTELRNVLLSPAVPPARKRAVIGRFAESAGLARPVRNFLYVVVDRRRISLLPQIRQACQALLDERMGILRTSVMSARPIDAAQQGKLQGELAGLTGKQVRCEYSVDEDLLGGLVARIGSTVYDGSVRGQLDALRRKLLD